jgi:para-aminobenzoate synthetase/4-amino-4-deoxychorismate lyase
VSTAPFVVLDFPPAPGAPPARLLFAAPRAVLVAHTLCEVREVLAAVDAHAAAGRHAAGFVAYEAAPAFDPAFRVQSGVTGPLAWFIVVDAPAIVPAVAARDARPLTWQSRTDAAAHAAAITAIHDAIGRGDLYQVNYTVRLDVTGVDDAAALYDQLLAAQGAGYGAHLHTGSHEIISASPELFFERRGTTVTTRPMKGTARRGRFREEDDAHTARLRESAKERAENVMIVDLLRNDLGRVAVPGSVRVPSLFDVEVRPTVLQMTSTITAEVPASTTTDALFSALFPCGSVTGAPKVAAMQHIAAHEQAPRGVYCGAIGHVAPGGQATFSVAIRTLAIDHARRRAVYGTGSGVTWDSVAADEYDETVAKAAVLTTRAPHFELLETMRAEPGVIVRRDAHLARLAASAAYFGWDADATQAAAARALDAVAAACHAPTRVRLTVARHGATDVMLQPAPADFAMPPTVVVATTPVNSTDVFLCHKTTQRAVYDAQRAAHPHSWDVLLWNERGELTESTIGNIVLELDGVRVTPARASGLLAGVLRDELLAAGTIQERVVTKDELSRATKLWVINALRGWVAVTLHA